MSLSLTGQRWRQPAAQTWTMRHSWDDQQPLHQHRPRCLRGPRTLTLHRVRLDRCQRGQRQQQARPGKKENEKALPLPRQLVQTSWRSSTKLTRRRPPRSRSQQRARLRQQQARMRASLQLYDSKKTLLGRLLTRLPRSSTSPRVEVKV